MVATIERPAPGDGLIDINANSVLLTLRLRRPGNRRKVNSSLVEVDADKDAITVGKELLDSKELKAVVSFDNQIRQYLYSRSLPAYGALKEGVYRLPLSLIDEVDAKLEQFQQDRQDLINKFLAVYPAKIDAARARLRTLFSELDYPSPHEVQGLFSMEYRYLMLGVPENLSASLIHREQAKARATVELEVDEIKLALRTSFADLVDHAAERLQSDPKGKKLVFRDSLVKNMEDFLQYFNQRNIVQDYELSDLVERARAVIAGVSADDLRQNDSLRAQVQQTMAEIKQTMDNNLMARPSRKITPEV